MGVGAVLRIHQTQLPLLGEHRYSLSYNKGALYFLRLVLGPGTRPTCSKIVEGLLRHLCLGGLRYAHQNWFVGAENKEIPLRIDSVLTR